ncbi:hypothetical protein OUZ56_028996 [Daphnia magna]|uniref:Uncharacterized protein n=1 Tax=Daphnia magna TaxID=35525 RepID=A0ABR0B5I2_9CRUS|nr:hypothetical protein OUZ56_028996 [Daphnia magna]
MAVVVVVLSKKQRKCLIQTGNISHIHEERERERDKSLVPYHSSGHPDFLVSIKIELDSKPSEYYSSDVMMTRIE